MDSPPAAFQLVGGHPVLDFVNTVGGNRVLAPREKLPNFADLVAWAVQSGVLSPPEGKALAREAAAHPGVAEQALTRAVHFRESLYRLLLAVAAGRPAPAAELAELDGEVRRAWAERRLQRSGGRYGWSAPDVALLDSVVPRVALAAAELMTGETLGRMRLCEATNTDGCGWLFLDQTRNHSRRWCEMASCGNKVKARRHYARVRSRT
jgi:predicted RNA-binding Zn ribbon-like protein